MKERLTGAIILVALLVLLVPELLTGPEPRTATPTANDGAQLRSYTIDLKDDATRQPPPPQAPVATASDEPVGQATPETETESPPAANVIPPADEATRSARKPMGSGADATAAAPDTQVPPAATAEHPATAKPGAGAPPSADDEKPRSAFGPNARPQPEKSASTSKPGAAPDASKASTAKADALKAEAAKAEAAKAEAAKAEAARTEARKAEAAKAEAAKADVARQAAAKAEATRLAAAKTDSAKSPSAKSDAPKPGAKGWAVQLGVFGSRDNAERLAKQVKGSGFPVLINETSGKDGKKLYWVRVGPEADAAGANALSAKLKAAGHRDARVVGYP